MRTICDVAIAKWVRASARFALFAFFIVGAGMSGFTWAQVAPLPAPKAPASAPADRRPVGKPAPVLGASSKAPAEPTKPRWTDLTAVQRQTLAPLAESWNTINEAQKRKWLALSTKYPKLPSAEQAVLNSRMSEWAGMSPQQRTQARLNFGETRQLAPDDRKAKWEAYQVLSAEEKRKLAADAPAKTGGTAAALKPVPPQKLAIVPNTGRDAKTPRITAGPATDAGFPLPQPQPQPQPGLTPVPAQAPVN